MKNKKIIAWEDDQVKLENDQRYALRRIIELWDNGGSLAGAIDNARRLLNEKQD